MLLQAHSKILLARMISQSPTKVAVYAAQQAAYQTRINLAKAITNTDLTI
ncbi:hypothetical protein EDC56_2441 [Sinobacterium caligoides]|uniref:Uncharacterized protein n=1 Tax=Sinobacterium caligoides TaxID=933926 RepID=A0A3N2DQP2_9GAMM|nr:hypothetical protein EDC56_2441 [Sinobacterium caligoides]